ncbi:HEPN domain-containing protein [Comamonas sp.]|uniref:HEPN domain-containing protein n=1 Tax=Comamonas sp. TaxID=34028 RepID=UPI00289FAF2B|nr:HEPN domain-containing protein [Comamonas sp.]
MNTNKLNYEYSFDCEGEIENFNHLSDEHKFSIEQKIVDVIFESFVQPADEDYVTARFLAQTGMHRAFFWSAAQAAEKYLKAFLLMRGISLKGFRGHPIAELYKEVCSVSKPPKLCIQHHPDIKIHPNFSRLFKPLSIDDFINVLEVQGSADNRYNSGGISFNSGYLFALDSFIFGLRRGVGVPEIRNSLSIMDRLLIDKFYLYNPWFSVSDVALMDLPNDKFNLSGSNTDTTLDRLVSGSMSPHSKMVLQWLEKKMLLPVKVKRYLNIK